MKQILEYKNIVIPLQRNRERLTTSRSGAVVARQAHNLEVVGSSPASATETKKKSNSFSFFIGTYTILEECK